MEHRGFTILEALATLAVVAVLAALSLPAMTQFQRDWRSTAAINTMTAVIHHARSLAITSGSVVTLCPGSSRCLGRDEWHHGAVVFVDANANGRIDGAERVERAVPGLEDGARLYWRAFRRRNYLQFTPSGYTAWQNGTFLYCPPDGAPQLARMIILNAAGRVRPAVDGDGDGVREAPDGRALDCP